MSVTAEKTTKGKVKVYEVGEIGRKPTVVEIEVDDDVTTVEEALKQAAVKTKGEVRVNNQPAEPTDTLKPDDLVTVVPRIKGG